MKTKNNPDAAQVKAARILWTKPYGEHDWHRTDAGEWTTQEGIAIRIEWQRKHGGRAMVIPLGFFPGGAADTITTTSAKDH